MEDMDLVIHPARELRQPVHDIAKDRAAAAAPPGRCARPRGPPARRSSPSAIRLRHDRLLEAELGRLLEALLAAHRGRTSPARPISPNAATFAGIGLSVSDETTARHTARSAAGSPMRTPPTALTKTSCSQVAMPAWRCSTASSMARRFASSPTESRRALGVCAGSTSAWISTSSGRVPSSVASTQEPGTGLSWSDKNNFDGLLTPLQPLLGHREHAELVHRAEAVLHRAHQAKSGVRIALEVEHGVDDVLEHARPGDRALLRDVADEEQRACRRAWRSA